MMLSNKVKTITKSAVAAFLIFVMLCAFANLPVFAARTRQAEKVVRVGWYESPFNITDDFGRRSGYAYEYQQKIAAFTGWKYEYVTGSWSDLMQMLVEGKLDLMSDVSFTEERSQNMHFSYFPMGTEEYYLFVAPDNEEITTDNLSALNGKTVGINKGSVQLDLFKKWAKEHKIDVKIEELTVTVSESLKKLQRGKIDAHVSLDGYFNPNEATPVASIGSSDFYFAVSNKSAGIINDLNNAMKRIQNEDPYYNQKLASKYIKTAGGNYFLIAEEKQWLKEHDYTIKVGYQDNYLAFCAKDPETGELTGALKDYLKVASDSFKNTDINFVEVSFPTAAAAMDAVKSGEVDCMFPANLTDYDGETSGFLMTNPLMRTDITAIVLESVKNSFLKKEHITVAVNEGNPNYNMFLVDNFPKWRPIIFKDTPEGLRAIRDGKADCLLMSNYRYNNVSKYCREYGLTGVSTGVELDYSFAVSRSNTTLYSILNKINRIVPSSTTESSLSYYYTEDAKITFGEMIKQNMALIMAMAGVILIILVALLAYNIATHKEADTNKKLILATQTDPLTGLYSRNYFYEYAARIYRENYGDRMDVIVINVEQFHSVNAIHGWEFGDNLIRVIGEEITAFVSEKGGIAGRSEADHFAIYCPHLDTYNDLYDRMQNKISEFSPNSGIWLRMGVMPWEDGLAPRQQLEQALIACNLARGRYNQHIVVFDGRVRERESYEQRLKNDLAQSISNRDFEVYYQPKFDIRPEVPVFAGAEALVRWNHPELGMIPPDDFINLFESNGQITLLDQYVWETVAEKIAEWKAEYGVTVKVSINLSRIDVYDPNLEERLDRLFEINKLDHSTIRLEVTESAYTENSDEMITIIKNLRKKGYIIEMDDFGTGYSSLNLLSSMPINSLKMDRAFIKNIDHEEKDVQLVKVILDIAKTLSIPVTAEGVENKTQLTKLKNLGCEMVQGYYFSRPLPANEFEERYLKTEKSV
ncbi:MAG: EAL domain-containing protein [Clostridia bacterium]|nr:EAL domain-containing protein [Clostridia bacterium]